MDGRLTVGLWVLSAVMWVSNAHAQEGRQLRIQSAECVDVDRQRFAELLILDLRDEGEVVDRALTVSLSCHRDSVVIRATDRDGGITVERRIPAPTGIAVGRERVFALAASQLLQVAQWTEPKPAKPEEHPVVEIIVEETEPPPVIEESSPAPAVLSDRNVGLGVGAFVRSRFPGDRAVTFGAELRGGVHLRGPWWGVANVSFDTGTTQGSLGSVRLFGVSVLAGVSWRRWWTEHIGWNSTLWLGGGYARLRGRSADPGLIARTHASGIFAVEVSGGPRWRFGRFVLGADIRLGLTAPRLVEAPPVGTTSANDWLTPGLAHVTGALVLEVEL